MQYMLLIYGDEAARGSATKEQMGQMYAAYGAYTEAMKKAGVFNGGRSAAGRPPRRPPCAPRTARRKVLNGPYAETKEQLGGYYLIEARRSRRGAVLGGALPRRQVGAIEVRPVWPM